MPIVGACHSVESYSVECSFWLNITFGRKNIEIGQLVEI